MNAMFCAMCAVLGYLALDFGNLKVTFESLPVFLAALLFGPVNGALVGGVGTLIYQFLRYGLTLTTPLWILPYALAGLVVGLFARHWKYTPTPRQTLLLVVFAELMITALNTGVLYIDSKLFGYYSPAFLFGSLGLRLVICVVKSVAFGLLLPALTKMEHRALRPGRSVGVRQ